VLKGNSIQWVQREATKGGTNRRYLFSRPTGGKSRAKTEDFSGSTVQRGFDWGGWEASNSTDLRAGGQLLRQGQNVLGGLSKKRGPRTEARALFKKPRPDQRRRLVHGDLAKNLRRGPRIWCKRQTIYQVRHMIHFWKRNSQGKQRPTKEKITSKSSKTAKKSARTLIRLKRR